MYSVEEFGLMIADESRTGAYARALAEVIGPESIVLDVGAGTGILSLLACLNGARRVYAVESGDSIALAARIARANGFADRITFWQGLSTDMELPERAHIVVSDLHGVLPWFGQHIPSIVDARTRLLAREGVLIPRCDSAYVAVVEAQDQYKRIVGPWVRGRFGLDLCDARRFVTNAWTSVRVSADQLLCSPACWAVVDYSTVTSASVAADVEFRLARAGVGHGLILWFDSELADGIGLSNAPGKPPLVYGTGFFPWTEPVALEAGDTVNLRLRADLVGGDYVWSWDTDVHGRTSGNCKAQFRQSTFFGSLMSPERLRKRSAGHRPTLGVEGQIDALILERMNGVRTLDEISDAVIARFPGHFRSTAEALGRVGELSDRYGFAAFNQSVPR